MDTPFGRLDITHGKKVLEFLPNLSEQIILLVTDREFRKEDENILENYINSDHTLVFRGEEKGSYILKTNDGRWSR
jgi:DNA sulfur modification protein DndD